MSEESETPPVKTKKRGRPRKSLVEGHKKKNAVGRPKGDAAIMNEYKARMLASPKSRRVLEAVFDAALTDGHPAQSAAWKLVMDRMLPTSMFEKEVDSGSARPTVNITIGTVGGDIEMSQDKKKEEDDDIIDGEVE